MTSSNKTLGIAKVKMTGRGWFLEDLEAKRMVDFPYASLALNPNQSGNSIEPVQSELLIYTAHLNDTRYRVHSACRINDLKHIEGALTIVDHNFKYGHLRTKSGSYRVFVPFSCRSPTGAQWFGQGAKLHTTYTVLAFRQPEIHGCNYVAWCIAEGSRDIASIMPPIPDVYRRDRDEQKNGMKKLERPTAVQRQSDHQQVEFVSKQTGVIYDIADNNVVSVTSPTCQNVCFAASLYEPWMKPGRFVIFDGRRVEEGKTSKLMGSNPVDAGSIFSISRVYPLVLVVSAVINKVTPGKSAWAWNDHIGRIFIPWTSTDRYMNQSRPLPFTSVHLDVSYNGKHDDIPWVATSASLCGEEEDYQIREENARMLKTEDYWRIQSVVDGPENPSIFLSKMDENNKKLTAFAKVIDMNSGEIPSPNTLVRLTYYEQKRHQRHALRAVLVSTMEKCERLPKVHMVHNGSGVKFYPPYYEEPTPAKENQPETPSRRVQVAPAPVKNCWNLAKLGTPQKAAVVDFPSVNGQSPKAAELDEHPVSHHRPDPLPLYPPGIPPPFVSRSTSMWSGTPVEAKPYPDDVFQAENQQQKSTYEYQLRLPELYVGDPVFFSEASVSQPSTASTSGPISDVRNTQSEASSPDPVDQERTFIHPESETNYWSSLESIGVNNNNLIQTTPYQNLFQYGFPQLDMPIFQKMNPDYDGLVSSSTQNQQTGPHSHRPCCESEQLLWDLWQNPKFRAAFSASDPEAFRRVDEKRQGFTNIVRHNGNINY